MLLGLAPHRGLSLTISLKFQKEILLGEMELLGLGHRFMDRQSETELALIIQRLIISLNYSY